MTTPDWLRTWVPDPVRRRYAAKLGVAFLAILVVMGFVGGFTFVQTKAELRTGTEKKFQNSAESRADSLGGWVEQIKQEARLMTQTAAVQSGNPDAIQAFYERQMATDAFPESVLAVHYLDLTGPVIRASSNEQFVGVNPKKRGVPFAQGGFSFGDRRAIISQPFMGPKVNEPVVAVIAPVAREKRAVILMVNVKTRQETLAQSGASTTRVVNGNGQIVMSPNESALLGQNVGGEDVQSPVVERGLAGQSGYMELGTDGREQAVGYAPVEGIDWVVMTEAPVSQAFVIQRRVSQNILFMLGAAFVGFLLVGALVYRGTVRDIERLVGKANRVEEGDLDVEFESGRVDEIGDLYRAFGSTCETIRERIEEAEDAQKAAEEARREAESANEEAQKRREEMEARARRLETIADEYRKTLERTADGDLTRRLDADVESDAMREVALASNDMLDRLSRTIAEVRQFAVSVDESTGEIATNAREIESASTTINETVTDIADGAARQNEHVQQVTDEMTDFSASIEEVASSTEEIARRSRKAADLGATGRDTASEAVAEMDGIVDAVAETVAEIERLDEEMDEIGEIVDLITDIAEQTNMLALNANIEAARAGGASSGEGFAVVADEVKSLAEETAERTQEIERSIADVQSSTTAAVEDMREMRERIEVGRETVESTGEIIEEIVEQVEDADEGIQSIDEATDDQAASTDETVSMVEQVGEVTERTATEASDVASVTDRQASSISTVNNRIDALSEQVSNLRDSLGAFDVDSGMPADSVDAGGDGTVAPTDDD